MPSTPYLDVVITADGDEILHEQVDCRDFPDDPDELVRQHQAICAEALRRGAREVLLTLTDPDGLLPTITVSLHDDEQVTGPAIDLVRGTARLLVRAAHENDAELLDGLAAMLYFQPIICGCVIAQLARFALQAFVDGARPSDPTANPFLGIVITESQADLEEAKRHYTGLPNVTLLEEGQEAPAVVRLVEAAFRFSEEGGDERLDFALAGTTNDEKTSALAQVLRIAADVLPHGRPVVEAALDAERGGER